MASNDKWGELLCHSYATPPSARLVEEIAVELLEAEAEAASTGKAARRYKDFRYATLGSWSRRRRVIGKADGPGARGQSALHRDLLEQDRDQRPLSL